MQDEFETPRVFGLLDLTCDAELLLGGTSEVPVRPTHEEYVRAREEDGQTPETNPVLVPWDEFGPHPQGVEPSEAEGC